LFITATVRKRQWPRTLLRDAVEPLQATGGDPTNFVDFVMQSVVKDLPSPGFIQDHQLID
jgi:hypothetical protein